MKLLLTAQEASSLLRERTSTTLRRLEEGEIPAYREGTQWKIPCDLLKNYVESKALSETRERRKMHEEKEKEND